MKLSFLALTMAFCGVTLAQQTGISGRVSDSSGGVIVSARVTLSEEGGAKLSTITNNLGIYQFPSLRAASYLLRVDAGGFTPVEKTVPLLLGQSMALDLSMRPAATTSTIDVLAGSELVETTTSQVGGNINPTQVSTLPLNGRNWMELSLLSPGVARNDVSFTPLGGDNSGKFQINVDGQQVTQNTADQSFGQPQYSRDAMDQFQVITNRFDATLGRSAQMQLNAQTKAGSNNFHGTAYGYFRSDSFNAADPIAQKVLPFSDKQYGGTLGGPIKKDKLWFFGAYEGEKQPSTLFLVPIGFAGQTFTFPSPLTTNSYLLRMDWQINDKNRLSIRGTGYTWGNPFTGPTGTQHPSRAASRTREAYAVFGTWTKTIGTSLVNEVKAGLNHFDWDNEALVPSQEYRFTTNTIGGPYNYPQNFIQNTGQFRDDLYWLKGRHSIKAGAEYLRTSYTGIFQQNLRGTVTSFASDPANFPAIFATWNDPSTWNLGAISPLAVTFVQGFGNFNIAVPTNAIGFWMQDDWKLSGRLTLNLGLRYDNDLGVFDPSLNLKSGIVTPRSGDNRNFGPRIGFAWDVTGSRKTVIRGGAGIYFGDIAANQVIDQQIFNGEQSLQPSVSAKPGVPISLSAPFGTTTGDDFISGKVPASVQAVQILGHNAHTPYSMQSSIGLEHQFAKDWTLTADFVHWRVYHDWVREDANLFYNAATGYNMNPATAGRPNPNFTTILTFVTPDAAGSIYDGLQMGLQRRLAKGLTTGAAYTFARLKDSSTGPFYVPNNPENFTSEWANSPDDQRHTLAINTNYQWKWGLQGSVFYHFGSGQAFATTAGGNPFGNSSSANRTFLATAKTYNPAANNTPSPTAAGYLVTARDALYGRNVHRVDARLSKAFAVHEHYRMIGIVEAFNLLNHPNYGAYNGVITSPQYGATATNSNLAYAARMLQLAARFEF
ncbi:MAG TPA: TonB-dependent receptor [Candidatus Solibacter sp.]